MRRVWVGIDRLCGALEEGGGNQELQDTGNWETNQRSLSWKVHRDRAEGRPRMG